MLKFFKYIFLFLLMMSLSSCSQLKEKKGGLENSSNNSNEEAVDKSYKYYKEAIAYFKPIDTDILTNKESFRNKFIFFGRITCPYCRSFAPILKNIAFKNGIDIYYINTDSNDQAQGLNEILNKYSIDEVPALIYLNTTGEVIKFSGYGQKDLNQFIQSKK